MSEKTEDGRPGSKDESDNVKKEAVSEPFDNDLRDLDG
jgi:hypothetical protein